MSDKSKCVIQAFIKARAEYSGATFRFREYSPIIVDFISKTSNKNSKILEIGGGVDLCWI